MPGRYWTALSTFAVSRRSLSLSLSLSQSEKTMIAIDGTCVAQGRRRLASGEGEQIGASAILHCLLFKSMSYRQMQEED
jgi:hypothetical protein